MGTTTRILLKARPTPDQLSDRLAAPAPDGVELYLDPIDLSGPDWRERFRSVVERAAPPRDFSWIVEAPIRTIGGQYFSLTADDDDHRETMRRVTTAGRDIGAVAANVHVVAPTPDLTDLNQIERGWQVARARGFLRFYVEQCTEAGLVPQVENVPPVGRMREAALVYSSIGAAAEDLLAVAEPFPTLRFCVDLSHAGLTLNWAHDRRPASERSLAESLVAVGDHVRLTSAAASLRDYLDALAGQILSIHVSNARGLLGEGLSYGDGDYCLDEALRPLVGTVPYFVTETLEPDPNRAAGMRDAQARLARLLAADSARQ